jgi:hypothetical protein
MKTILTILFTLFAVSLHAQTGVLMDRYYFTGSMSIGQGDRGYADNSAWLQLGKDTTKKGLLMPRVILDSITTTKRALYVYDLKDSVLYHFDGSKRVRYMTYKDTTFIKTLSKNALSAGTGIGYNNSTGVITNTGVTTVDGSSGAVTLSASYFKQNLNSFGAAAKLGTADNNALGIWTNNLQRGVINANGTWDMGNANITQEGVVSVTNDAGSTNKVWLGVGRGGAVVSGRSFIAFGASVSEGKLIYTNQSGILNSYFEMSGFSVIQVTNSNGFTVATELRSASMSNAGIGGTQWKWGSRENTAGNFAPTNGDAIINEIPYHLSVNSDWKPASGNSNWYINYSRPRSSLPAGSTATGHIGWLYWSPIVGSGATPAYRMITSACASGYDLYLGGGASQYILGNVGMGALPNGTDKLNVAGSISTTTTIKTGQPSANGAGAVKIGKVITGATVTIQTDKYLEVEIDGVIRKLALAE